jgi:3(or 17)beta-hydroxysteroid dehydrogenase
MTGRVAGKVAIVTGGGSGIGRATAGTLAREGAKVIVADIDFERAKVTADAIGPSALAVKMDVRHEAEWQAVTARAIELFGKLDIVCNVAGIGFAGSIEDLTADQWQKMVDVNLTGVVWGCKHGIKAIRTSGGSGAIINVSSLGGLVGIADVAAYCATKGGVTILSKSVALHCAEQHLPIRCVSIHPTYVDSEMLDPVAAAFPSREAMLQGMSAQVPMGRVAKPQDIANAILFAASDEAAMISGSAIIVDGAQLAGPKSAHVA